MSQAESKTKVIDGHTFEVFMLPPMTALRNFTMLVKMLGPGLQTVLSEKARGMSLEALLDGDDHDEMAINAIAGILERLDEDKVEYLVKDLESITHCDGTELSSTSAFLFRGKMKLMLSWIWFALTVQYADFSDAWALVSSPGHQKKESPSTSPNTSPSNGQSGVSSRVGLQASER